MNEYLERSQTMENNNITSMMSEPREYENATELLVEDSSLTPTDATEELVESFDSSDTSIEEQEEAAEVVDAATTVDDQHVIHEVADLWFHCMVLMTQRGLRPEQVLAELQRRFGVSGHTEKLSRASAE